MANGFMGRLEGLLSGENTMGNLGLGLLAASGPSTQPQGIGQILGQGAQFASNRQQQAMQNQAFRDQMMQRRQQQEAQAKISGLLERDEPPSTDEFLGLLSQASPDAFNQVMMQRLMPQPQNQRPTAAITEMAQFGFEPTKEGFAEYMALKQQQGADDQTLAKIQLQMNMMQLEDARRARAEKERTVAQTRRMSETNTERTLHHLREAAELNAKLAPTFLRSGASGQEIRRTMSQGLNEVKRFFGTDTSEAEQLLADYDRFNKLNSAFIVESMSGIAGSGTVTDSKLKLIGNSMAGVGITPGANNKIYADSIEALLDIADIEDYSVSDRRQMMKFAQQLRGSPERTEIAQAETQENRRFVYDPQTGALVPQ